MFCPEYNNCEENVKFLVQAELFIAQDCVDHTHPNDGIPGSLLCLIVRFLVCGPSEPLITNEIMERVGTVNSMALDDAEVSKTYWLTFKIVPFLEFPWI